MNLNYQKILEKTIEENQMKGIAPKLLLHSCCAPCSSYCIEYLSNYFEITIFYYNPNIYPEEEYSKRVKEQEQFTEKFPTKHPVTFLEGEYEKDKFYELTKGFEEEKEGGERCFRCYEMRLREAAEAAKKYKMDYFTTTLSISPLKNAAKLNEIGAKLEKEYGIPYLYSDFKKKGGYQRSVALSKEYGMYRQYYCGCVFSKNQRDKEIAEKEKEMIQ